MSENVKLLSVNTLERFLNELFQKAGMPIRDAEFQTKSILQANLWGIDSHGVIRVPTYFQRMLCGAIKVKPDMRLIKGDAAFRILDADGAAGCVAAKYAMEQAIKLAKEYNIAAVGVINSNHFGAAGLYSKIAADEGSIGISMTNVLPLVAAPGARGAVVGNNPLSISIPTYTDFPFLLDMSLSVVAGGKLRVAAKKGEKIPLDWAVDSQGRPTDDPEEAIKGFLLPMAGFKGLGLAYAIDMLSGLITGGLFADKMRSMYSHPTEPSMTGHMMIALNLEAVLSKESIKERMLYYKEYLCRIPMVEEGKHLMFPGEIEYNCMLDRLKNGIPVPITTIKELRAYKEQNGIKSTL